MLKGSVSGWENGRQYPSAAHRRTLHAELGPFGGLPGQQVAEQAAPYSDRSVMVRLSPAELRIIGIYRWLVNQSEKST